MIAGHLRIAIKEPLADAKNVKAAKENNGEEQTENDPEDEDGIAVLVNDSNYNISQHSILDRRPACAWLLRIDAWAARSLA